MIKHKKIPFLMSGFLLAGVVIIGAQSALAYLTDYKSVVNTIKIGNNTTSIEEEFPTVTPIRIIICNLHQFFNDLVASRRYGCYRSVLCKSKSLLFDFRYGNLYNPGNE